MVALVHRAHKGCLGLKGLQVRVVWLGCQGGLEQPVPLEQLGLQVMQVQLA